MTTIIIIGVLLLLLCIFTVMVSDLLISVIGLAAVSVLLTVAMFYLKAPLAGVFELSVCAGLITAIFVSVVSLTKPQSREVKSEKASKRIGRYVWLPFILAVIGMLVYGLSVAKTIVIPSNQSAAGDVRSVLWDLRQVDLVGLMLILLVGVFGIVVLFKEKAKNE